MYVYICTCIIIYTHTCAYIWVNYNMSLTWIVRPIWGWFPLLTMIPVRENSEVVRIYPYIYVYIHMYIYILIYRHHFPPRHRDPVAPSWSAAAANAVGKWNLKEPRSRPMSKPRSRAGIIPRYFFLKNIYRSICPSIYLSMHACMFHNIIYIYNILIYIYIYIYTYIICTVCSDM